MERKDFKRKVMEDTGLGGSPYERSRTDHVELSGSPQEVAMVRAGLRLLRNALEQQELVSPTHVSLSQTNNLFSGAEGPIPHSSDVARVIESIKRPVPVQMDVPVEHIVHPSPFSTH